MKYSTWIVGVCLLAFVVLPGVLAADEEQTVAAVDFKKLVALLATPPAGFTAVGKAEGSRLDMGEGSWSTAVREFKKGQKRVKITILDGAYMEQAYAAFNALKMFSYETSDGYVKGVTINGHAGIRQQENSSKKHTVMLLVAGRFLVQWEGKKLASMDELDAIVNGFDFSGLTALK
ncbi:MAG TPA: hypothetical protein PLM00_01760 [Spirochaetota bacterium]|nr:hypothetical protein [Spirochaetota bacterium]HPH03394.1 hypothetical protein [Spirochaetota bacterium]HPN82085.1 hypothetical protein [Spirochaetota bacterium]